MAGIEGRRCREIPPFDDPRRRWWLLTEALKCAPLREALEIARAAEVFLTVGSDECALEQQSTSSGDGGRWPSEDEASGGFAPSDGARRRLH